MQDHSSGGAAGTVIPITLILGCFRALGIGSMKPYDGMQCKYHGTMSSCNAQFCKSVQ